MSVSGGQMSIAEVFRSSPDLVISQNVLRLILFLITRTFFENHLNYLLGLNAACSCSFFSKLVKGPGYDFQFVAVQFSSVFFFFFSVFRKLSAHVSSEHKDQTIFFNCGDGGMAKGSFSIPEQVSSINVSNIKKNIYFWLIGLSLRM